MRLPRWLAALTLTGRIALAVGALLLILAAWWFLTEPGRQRARAAQAEAGQTLAEGRAKAGSDAVGILDKARTDADANETLTRENADAIRNAPGADQRLDPGLNDAARRRVCNRPSFRHSDECVQLLGRPEPAR